MNWEMANILDQRNLGVSMTLPAVPLWSITEGKRVLYGKRVFENKKDKIRLHEKVLTKVGRNAGKRNAGI